MWDGILIRGRVTNKKEYAMVFLQNAKTGEEFSLLAHTNVSGYFEIPLSLPKLAWKYYIVIASGNSFESSTPESITLLSRDTISHTWFVRLANIPNLIYDTSSYISFGSGVWANMLIQQWDTVVEAWGKILIVSGLPLSPWNARVMISWQYLSSVSPRDTIPKVGFIYSGSIFIDRTRDRIGEKFVTLRTRNSLGTMQFRLKSGEQVLSTYFLSSPSGNVTKHIFPSNLVDANGFLRTNVLIRQNFQIPDTWVYKIETVRSNWYAHFNLPISRRPFWSIYEPLVHTDKTTLRIDKKLIDENIVSRINLLRNSLNRNPLKKDQNLMALAEKKAMDMAEYNYVGHVTHSGKNILDFADSIHIDITGTIGENVAGGNVSDLSLQDGLEESGSHKYNMINPNWKHIGIGYVLRNGRTYLVQIFGE